MARWRARCRQVLQPGPQLRQWASTHLIYVMHTQSRGERGGGNLAQGICGCVPLAASSALRWAILPPTLTQHAVSTAASTRRPLRAQ